MNIRIAQNVLSQNVTLGDVLRAIDKSPIGIVFFVNQQGQLKGIMTDGDIRRAVMAGTQLEDVVSNHMVKDFVFGKAGNSRRENARLINEVIRHLPILDDGGRIVDFLSITDFLYLPVMEPSLTGRELEYVKDCIETNWISSQGQYVKKFEEAFADYHNIDYALTTSNGTTALHLAMTALGVGPGDEVIVPDLTFAASANAVIYCGARPVLVDVHPDYWNIDPELLESAITPKTKAIMPVHLYGHPCDMEPILEISRKHGLYVVEDCAEALGARYKGRLVGTMGEIGCFSFFSNKIITTGEGGMVITKHPELRDKMELYRDHGMDKDKRYWHEVVGFNYRMTNVQAAIGLGQMEQIDTFLEKRQKTAKLYSERCANLPGITLPPQMEWAENIYWLYSILVNESDTAISRDQLMLELKREGIETRPLFHPLHKQPPYLERKRRFQNSERLSAQGLSLPSGNNVSDEEVQRITKTISKIILNHQHAVF